MDAYANHLAQVNQVQDVIATENICNSQGQLLIPKGKQIDAKAAERVIKFKLLKPIEDAVAIDKELNKDRLKARFTSYLSMDPSFIALQQKVDITKELDTCCEAVCKFDILRQKLTVLSLQLPRQFDQALFVGWFSIAILKHEKAPEERLIAGFIAALTHDLGSLHINPELLNSNKKFTDDEFKQLHSHPLIGEKILGSIKGVSKEAAHAVAEHHENLDGTGYPKHKLGKQLGSLGRMLNLLDSVNAIYSKHFKPLDNTLHDLIPIIQMNEQSLYNHSARSLIYLLRMVNKTQKCNVPDHLMPELIDNVFKRHTYICEFVESTKGFIENLGLRHENARLFALQNSFLHINVSLAQSGLINEGYMRWLEQVKVEKLEHAYKEVEEVYLMMGEIGYHIGRFTRQLNHYLEGSAKGDTQPEITSTLSRIQSLKQPQIPQSISDHLYANSTT